MKPSLIVDVVVMADRELLARWVAAERHTPRNRKNLLDGFSHYCHMYGTAPLRMMKFSMARWEEGFCAVDELCPELKSDNGYDV